MDQATLVGPDLSVGSEVLTALDAAGLQKLVALFAVFPEYGDWRFVISSPSLDQSHQLRAYERVAEILGGRFAYTLPPIMVLPIKDPFVKELRRLFGRARDVTGMRLAGQMIGSRFLSNAYIYRIG